MDWSASTNAASAAAAKHSPPRPRSDLPAGSRGCPGAPGCRRWTDVSSPCVVPGLRAGDLEEYPDDRRLGQRRRQRPTAPIPPRRSGAPAAGQFGEAKTSALIAAMKKAHPEKSIRTLSYGVAGLGAPQQRGKGGRAEVRAARSAGLRLLLRVAVADAGTAMPAHGTPPSWPSASTTPSAARRRPATRPRRRRWPRAWRPRGRTSPDRQPQPARINLDAVGSRAQSDHGLGHRPAWWTTPRARRASCCKADRPRTRTITAQTKTACTLGCRQFFCACGAFWNSITESSAFRLILHRKRAAEWP